MTIRRGASGQDVRKIQTRLVELGLYRGTIDGSFGGGTEGALRSLSAKCRSRPERRCR